MIARVALLATIVLVEVHGPAGQRIFINPAEVDSLREPRGADASRFAKGTKCLAVMANGKLIAVTDPCDQVRLKLEYPAFVAPP